ncbi:MAG: hypothetical protein JXR34_02255 [Bacteroidales bacterium]|nr:hypothetical protein [Bacteroidales bacterium]
MESINVQIDISTKTGLKLLREIQKHPKVAKVEYEMPEKIAGQKIYSLDEAFDQLYDKLSELYGIDIKNI